MGRLLDQNHDSNTLLPLIIPTHQTRTQLFMYQFSRIC